MKRRLFGRAIMATNLRLSAALLFAAATALAGACDPPPGDGATETDAASFIAFAPSFASFRTWPSRTFAEAAACGATHAGGPRTLYANRLPPPDASAFPVGTMLVISTALDGRLYAQVKRGGGFNAAGAVDWEWFELAEADGNVVIQWRGTAPPAGAMPPGKTDIGCNACHAAAGKEDFVFSVWPGLGGAAVMLPDGLVCGSATAPGSPG
jgi:hypothetical protein